MRVIVQDEYGGDRRARRLMRAACRLWLARLRGHERDELASVLLMATAGELPRSIVGDWCEDHGGQRGYRRWLALAEILEGP